MPKLFFKYAAMNAGKSTALLQCAHNYRERGMKPVLFTSSIDNRYGIGKIVSRIGLEEPAITYTQETDFLKVIEDLGDNSEFDVILIDEAQFLTRKQVIDLAYFVNCDFGSTPVICYGIKTDFLGNLFEGSNALICYAQDIQLLKTICRCGSAAHHNMRLDVNGDAVTLGQSVEIGGNDRYEAVCTPCFFQHVKRENLK